MRVARLELLFCGLYVSNRRWKRQVMKDFIEGVWSEEAYDPHECRMSCRVLKSGTVKILGQIDCQ